MDRLREKRGLCRLGDNVIFFALRNCQVIG